MKTNMKMVLDMKTMQAIQTEVGNRLGTGETDMTEIKATWVAKNYYPSEVNRAIRDAVNEAAAQNRN